MEELDLKKKALVTGGIAKDVTAIGVFVINLKQTNPALVDEVVIFHDGISNKDQKAINSVFPCRFIYYQFPGYNPSDFSHHITDYFSQMVFCKYECFRLLAEYSVVIWSDYDVVLLKSLSELVLPSNDRKGGLKFLTTDSAAMGSFMDTIKEVDMSRYNPGGIGICGSLFVLFDTLNDYMKYYEWLLQKTKEWGKYLYAGEQASINMLLQEFNIDVSNLEGGVYCVHPVHNTITEETKILHAYGQPKFWSGLKNDIWEDNYRKWVTIGGSKVKERLFSFRLKRRVKNELRRIKQFFAKRWNYFNHLNRIRTERMDGWGVGGG
jgi:lipopolysaccharide biosynthesis glycosyltransferase